MWANLGQRNKPCFKGGKFDGEGTLYAADGSISQSGTWADGNFLGTAAAVQPVAMEPSRGGGYTVPLQLNGVVTLNALVDSGASDVSIPADVFGTLWRANTVAPDDFLGESIYTLADGSRVPSQRFRLKTLRVGTWVVENVEASISSANAEILLGQSFLGRFKSWSIDNDRHVLILK